MAGRLVGARESAGDVVLTWEFIEAPNQRYLWRAVAADGSITQESVQTFASLEECAADLSRAWTVHRDRSSADDIDA